MNIKNTAKLFLGSVIVYAVTASCVASGNDVGSQFALGGHGSVSASSGTGGMGGIMDPVPNANAEPYVDGARLKLQY